MKYEPDSDKVQLGEVFQQSKNNAKEIEQLREDLGTFARDIRNAIENVSSRLANAGRPNYSALRVAVTTLIAFISLIGYFEQREMDRNTQAIRELDVKLQREFSLVADKTEQRVAEVNRSYSERHVDALDRIAALKSFNDSWVQNELSELRQRRLNDSKAVAPLLK